MIKIGVYAKVDKVKRTITYGKFEWDEGKAAENLEKHGISFFEAIQAFFDEKLVIATDEEHSDKEQRYFCLGKIESRVATVRFTYRQGKVRIIGAGFWRNGRKFYEEENHEKS